MSPPSFSPSIDGPNTSSSSHRQNFDSAFKGPNGSTDDYTQQDDDDPFGLGTNGYVKKVEQSATNNRNIEYDDDVLGLLGRPVSEFSKPQPGIEKTPEPAGDAPLHPQDKSIAELVDMGFSPEKSRIALEATESGADVQAAVGWLLNQAQDE